MQWSFFIAIILAVISLFFLMLWGGKRIGRSFVSIIKYFKGRRDRYSHTRYD